MPDWLYPITPATIGILALVGLFIVKVIHEIVVHWREDRRDGGKGGPNPPDE